MKRSQRSARDDAEAAPPADPIATKRAELAEADATLARRRSQLTDTEAAAQLAEASAKAIADRKRELYVPARVDNDAHAQAKLQALDAEQLAAEIEARNAAATAAELRRAITVAEYAANRARRELAVAENRAAADRLDHHRAELNACLDEQALPLLRAILNELSDMNARAIGAGLKDTERGLYLRYESLAAELHELIWRGTQGFKLFASAWGRPMRHERARIPADRLADTAADLDGEND